MNLNAKLLKENEVNDGRIRSQIRLVPNKINMGNGWDDVGSPIGLFIIKSREISIRSNLVKILMILDLIIV